MARVTYIKKTPVIILMVILTVFLTYTALQSSTTDIRDPRFEYFYGPARVPHIPEEDFPKPRLDRKYFLYACSEAMCGGLGDRQEGIVAAYLIAQMMGRRFGLVMTVPCDITKFVKENKESWIIAPGSLSDLSSVPYKRLDGMAWQLRNNIHIGTLEYRFPQDAIFFNVNQEFVQYLKKLPRFRELKWAQNRTVPEIYNIVLRRLYNFNFKYQNKFETFQNSFRKEGKKLVCAHVRLFTDRSKSYHNDEKAVQYVSRIWRFLEIYNDPGAYRMFVATNSEFVRKEAKKKFAGILVDMEGPIRHVDQDLSGKQDCLGLGKSLLDQMILSSCDVLLLSDSGFGRVAAMLRGTDDNLYNLAGPVKFSDKDFLPAYW